MAHQDGRCDGGALSLPILPADAVDAGAGASQAHHAPRVRASRATKWRFVVLFVVQALIVAHIVQWLWSGRTITPVEPSESMETVKHGIVNAGTVLFGLALLSTVVLGRWFCGWGCHVLLLQDGCGWILKKLGVRPRPFRARLLMLIPLLLALYMFVWPLAYRWAIAPYVQPDLAPLHFQAGFVTENFWATFPGVMVAVPFLFVCGALAVYFLGQKGYCTYGCPYGGFFAPIDRVSPLRIRVNDACEHCGHCTAVCTSNVRVHEEVAKFGMVVDPGCMKCLDCVSVCPNEALSVGWGRPALGAAADDSALVGPPGHRHAIADHPPELSRREEIAVFAIGLFTLLAVNAPTDLVPGGIRVSLPLLFASGVAAIVAFLSWKSWRIIGRKNEAFHGVGLRRAGWISAAGWTWLVLTAASLAVVALVGAQNTALAFAHRADRQVDLPPGMVFTTDAVLPRPEVLASAERADRWYEFASLIGRGGIGFVPTVQPWIDVRRAWLAAVQRNMPRCEEFLRSAWSALPVDAPQRANLAADIGRAIWVQGRFADLDAWYEAQFAAYPSAAHPEWEVVHRDRVTLASNDADIPEAIIAARAWLAWKPDSLEAKRQLSLLLVEKGDDTQIDEGIALIHETLEVEPDNPAAWRAIAIGHARAQRFPETEAALRKAVAMAPDNWRYWQGLGEFLRGIGREEDAAEAFKNSTRLMEAETAAKGQSLPAPAAPHTHPH